MRTILLWLLRLFYGFRAFNKSVLETPGPVLLLPNHTSWWDWLLVGLCVESDWKFATSREAAEVSWIHKRIMLNKRTFPVDINSPYAVKHMAEYLQKGGRLVLFPEGRLSRTGSLMKLFDGTGFLIFKTRAKVITAYLRGTKHLPLSPNPSVKQWLPRLSIHFSPVLTPPKFAPSSISETRGLLTDWLYDRMVQQQFETEMQFGPATVPEAIDATARRRSRLVAVQDATMQKLSYRKLLVAGRVLARQWAELAAADHGRVGVLLPNVNAVPATLLGLWGAQKVPAILNYTTGPAMLVECARMAGLKQIITSRSFIETAHIDIKGLVAEGIEIIFLEDVRAGISLFDQLTAALAQFFHSPIVHRNRAPEHTALILFTSGSEGTPKGVELSHRNLLANVRQLLSVMDLLETDRFFNAMPLFHSFGVAIGLLLPLIGGVFVFLYLSPLHYRVVPSALYNLNCTVFFGTNTFLAGYARKAHPYDFRSLRYLFAGAEKLQEATAALWQKKFGVRILEGYGATECSPCVTLNTPMRNRPGTVGQFLPCIEHKLEPVEGVAGNQKVGRLFVRGPNVMLGYLNQDANAAFQALGGWYDTGDIVEVDSQGYVKISGRLKRFAKVSGEMVSLTAVEDALADAFPQYGLRFAAAVVAKPDESRGEKLVAVTNESALTLEQVREAIRSRGLSSLAAPREVKLLRDIPRLGSGKIDHRELEKMI